MVGAEFCVGLGCRSGNPKRQIATIGAILQALVDQLDELWDSSSGPGHGAPISK